MLTNSQSRQAKNHPLGATWDGEGTNFAIFSENATGVELCLFDEADQETRVPLTEVENYIWYRYLPGVKPGQKYGFRVDGPYQPEKGHRFNPAKLLLDTYAKAIAGDIIHGEEIFGYRWDAPETERDLSYSETDNAQKMPKSVVVDDSFDWQGDRLLQIPWQETIIYETHVKGFTQQHPDIPEALRGTYTGLTHPAAIAHLKSLGITAVELLPIHHFFLHSGLLADKGLVNYWGYDPLGYFAPYSGYSYSDISGQVVTEFKEMVKNFHAAGMEVILDVVYNHTGEGNHLGSTLSFRGIDNSTYYRLVEGNPRYYIEGFTGCGNCLNTLHPQVLKLIMDSLRYWVTEMHIDGFRFDIAAALGRGELIEVDIWRGSGKRTIKVADHDFDPLAAFFAIIHQDPILSQVKLIAEAWDGGENGYQVGNFPVLWSEWNDKYRDGMRDFWRGEDIKLKDFADSFRGSPNLYQSKGRLPHASINHITCHDGFTLNDLVSYNEKHNEANGEDSGGNHNYSWNCGLEGETDDLEVLQLRSRQKRNFLATMMLSQGVPMLLGGDEMGRTQQGNNNPYCQDNEISWFNWDLSEDNQSLLNFFRQLSEFRRQHPVFRQDNWLDTDSDSRSINWFNADGSKIIKEQWENSVRAISIFLNGAEISKFGISDDSFLLFFNSGDEMIEFLLPSELQDREWRVVIDTNEPILAENRISQGNQSIEVERRSLVVLGGS